MPRPVLYYSPYCCVGVVTGDMLKAWPPYLTMDSVAPRLWYAATRLRSIICVQELVVPSSCLRYSNAPSCSSTNVSEFSSTSDQSKSQTSKVGTVAAIPRLDEIRSGARSGTGNPNTSRTKQSCSGAVSAALVQCRTRQESPFSFSMKKKARVSGRSGILSMTWSHCEGGMSEFASV